MARSVNHGILKDKALLEKLAKIALPIAVQGVATATLNLIDTLMVGMLGEAQLAAVGVAQQVFFIHILLLFGFNSGVSTFLAQFYGSGDRRNIRKTLGFGMTVTFSIGLIFCLGTILFRDNILGFYSNDPALQEMARPYVDLLLVTFFLMGIASPLEIAFKATQKPKIPMLVSWIVFGTNTFLNYVLIFGHFGAPALGIRGAAMATVTARSLEALLMLWFAFGRRGSALRGPLRDFFGWDGEMVRRILRNAFPTTLNEVFWALGTSMYVAAFSRMSTTSYAAYQASESVRQVFSFAAFSVGDAALILVGERLGRGDKEGAYQLAGKLLKIGVITGILFGMIIAACAWPLVHLFALTPLGHKLAFRILLVTGGTMFLMLFVGICTTGILRGGGDTRFAALTEVSCIWLISVPLAFASSLWWHLPVYLAVLCMRFTELVESLILVRRIRSGKWMNTVIRGL